MKCLAKGCSRAVPARQPFCGQCLAKLDDALRHKVLFSFTDARRAEAVAEAEKVLGSGSPSMAPPSPAKASFRRARELAATATKILERKEK